MDPLWYETFWSYFKYFKYFIIILIVSTIYTFVHLLDNKVFYYNNDVLTAFICWLTESKKNVFSCCLCL